jgi:hypothetical protein
MSIPLPPALSTTPTVTDLQTRFLVLLPCIERHGLICFNHVKCQESRREAVAEVVALCWLWYARLAARGQDAAAFPAALAGYAARAVRCGRRLCGQERARDVLSPLAQRRHGFTARSLPSDNRAHGSEFEEALRDNTRTPPADQAAFRVDFPAWLVSQGERRREIAEALMLGERTDATARRFDMSPARVSQLRREFQKDWQRYCADPAEAASV